MADAAHIAATRATSTTRALSRSADPASAWHSGQAVRCVRGQSAGPKFLTQQGQWSHTRGFTSRWYGAKSGASEMVMGCRLRRRSSVDRFTPSPRSRRVCLASPRARRTRHRRGVRSTQDAHRRGRQRRHPLGRGPGRTRRGVAGPRGGSRCRCGRAGGRSRSDPEEFPVLSGHVLGLLSRRVEVDREILVGVDDAGLHRRAE